VEAGALLFRAVALDVSGWHDFYVMTGGAAAALTGLVVVALSLHAKAIMAHPLYRDRAFAAIVALLTQVFLAGAVLVPDQPPLALGLEVGIVAVFWLVRSLWAIPYIRSNAARLRRRPHEFRRSARHWVVEWAVWITWVIALIASAAQLIAGSANGMYFLAAAMVLMFGSQVWSAWVLVAEVTE
jgi:modulator of FtsH protease